MAMLPLRLNKLSNGIPEQIGEIIFSHGILFLLLTHRYRAPTPPQVQPAEDQLQILVQQEPQPNTIKQE